MKKTATAVIGAGLVATLAACGSNPPTEVKVPLEDGRYASCIVVYDDTDAIEEMICDWPEDYTPTEEPTEN